MSDARMDDHEQYDELAAGYALDALEPDEELVFTEHLAGCTRCAQRLDEHTYVAAQLASLAKGDDAGAPEWSSIRRAVVGESQGQGASAVSLDERRSRRRQPRLLAAAAGTVALIGAGAVAWQVTSGGGGSNATEAIAACRHDAACRIVQLHADGGDRAAVLVTAGRVRVVPLKLGRPATGHTYVLWQLPRSGSPAPLGEFRNTASVTSPSSLLVPYADTAAFAVSLERSDITPSAPTDVVAVGQTG